ncbi:DUF4099 domain-containing protein [Algoriphagus boritolerans]|uniref:DUF4099 domain-containing protein n=1 Tax=Algoriphagus boritolerans TaxID=308111 RepID=UPI000B15F7C9
MKSQNGLPMKDLEIFGVIKNGKFTIPEKEVNALKNGGMTDIVELTDLKGKDIYIDKLPARLSIVRGEDGNPALRIDPVYMEPNRHPSLNDSERNQLVRKELANIKKKLCGQRRKHSDRHYRVRSANQTISLLQSPRHQSSSIG